MKKILILILLALFVQAGFAQEEPKDEMKTLITGKHLKFSGVFISPELKGTIINDGSGKDGYGFLMGGRMGIIFNDKFSIGLGGYGLTTEHIVDLTDNPAINDNAKIGFGYGGLVLEYTLFGNKAFHFTIPVLVGGGGVSLYKDIIIDEDNFTWDDFNTYESSAFFVVEPGINLELNLTKFMRFDLGASYRMVQFSEMDYLDNSNDELSNLAVNASLKFGLFSKTKKVKTTK
ncbi:MAG: hypothetical protein A2X13_10115 [Bacteroidetes bacterium GWC2_33_15]|nr:MAG: hypothetical protein A2X10_02670 [Bacteroidetes bacterium GWA2_33_15]OFX48762.1 MAG: hypothetical protein A2X13_10115 [Bacteroidetes bacterium GWC2_33_15]OFX66004.1 MAG: hypothetical protein A2X15_11265 [Bacteroidetes bacterium GWB2_32_14]OFX68235.1 MAG: hypothetical protein A2X14_07630 [Bacteroidetes bacterium GWD2_33_33]HAN18013.1 hypothetical protein [Bacteroidales bacterium]